MTGLITIGNALHVFLISLILTKVILLIEIFIGDNIINQEQCFESIKLLINLFDPIVWMITWFYQDDFRIIPKPFSTPVCFVMFEHGTHYCKEIEMIFVFFFE